MRRSWPLIVLMLALVGCVPQVVRPQPPAIELLEFRLLRLDPFAGSADFDLRLKLTNPNTVTLPILDSTLTAELAGAGFAMTLGALDLPAGGSRETLARLRVPVVEGARSLGVLLSGQPTRLRVSGEVRVSVGSVAVPLGPLTFVDRTVQVSLNFQLPTLRLVDLRLEGGSLRIGLEVSNPNLIGFSLEGPVRVLIGGSRVAEVSLDMRLPPGARERSDAAVRLSGFPGLGSVQVQVDLKARVPGIWERDVRQVLEGVLR
ncbi:LEA type 2 family protein [Calidithermus roseus]|uniref:Late embryogenesis abundant protein n=1 Tax=Calidithermus roseus TaxID=1644118 RepID=A0A399EG84_9DEIN|nr:LEA type 2 family protein [Calidithermus roseus]RIH83657.1 Late embryogenesis abundant protein [Calidithermus roseus]